MTPAVGRNAQRSLTLTEQLRIIVTRQTGQVVLEREAWCCTMQPEPATA